MLQLLISNYCFFIPIACALFSVVTGVILYRYIPTSLRLLTIGALFSISTDCLCFNRYDSYNLIIHNTYFFIDFFILLFATRDLLPVKKVNWLFGIFSMVFLIAYTISRVMDGPSKLHNYAFAICSLIIVINYLIVLYYNERNTDDTNKLPIRLICFSIVVYHCCTFPLFLIINDVEIATGVRSALMRINNVFDSVKYLMLGLGFFVFKLCHLKNKQMING